MKVIHLLRRTVAGFALLGAVVLLSACGGGSSSGGSSGNGTTNSTPLPGYAVGGSIFGLIGSVVLQDNGGDNLSVTTNGTFVFATKVTSGTAYNVTVLTQPTGQTCTVINGNGAISGNVANVSLACISNSYTIGGTVIGLAGSVVLQDNGGDNLTVSSNGAFNFATKIVNGNTYNVTIRTQPTGQLCSVSTGAGTVSGNNVGNVAVVCSSQVYTVGGAVSGLTGSVVLQNNNGDNLTLSANAPYTFPTAVASGSAFSVTVLTQPAGETCSVANGTGTSTAGVNITNAAVSCAVNNYTIGGTVTGLNGSMVLQDNGGDNLTVATNGAFTFATALPYGTAYNVTLLSLQFPNQTCTITGGSGTAMAKVTSVAVNCVPLTVRVNPATVTAGGPAFTLTALGTGFLPASVVQLNGVPRAASYVSPTEVLAQITAADIAASGVVSVTVVNPGPPSVAASAVPVTIVPPSKDAVAFQMNATHSGAIDFNGVTAGSLPAAAKWGVNLGGAPSYALTGGGKVFVTVALAAGGSQLVALDQATGATVWGPIALSGAANAAYDSGTVFALSAVMGGAGVMQAYDAATGTIKWSTTLVGQYMFSSPPTAANGFVYTGGAGGGGTLYAVNQATGAIAWTNPVANGDSSAPVVSADGVYVTYPCQTYDFRPATGESVWSNSTGCSGGGGATPILANGILYSPNGMGGTYNGSTFAAGTGAGALPGTYTADNLPAIGSTTTGYFLQSKVLRGISLANNAVLWSFTGDGLLNTSPIVVKSGGNSYVFVGSSGGNLYALDGATGAQLWTKALGAAIPNGSGWGARMPISGLEAGNGLLLVPAGNTLTAYTLSAAP